MRRILTIDGGGIKGVFPAAFLAQLEDRLGRSAGDFFDLIAGTSTGGIIALGLGLGLTAKDVLRFYRQHGREIFPPRRFGGLLRFLHSKYSHEPLRQVLTTAFGRKRLGDSRKRLLIPSLNLAAERVHLYKTAHNPTLIHDYKVPAVEVALATIAAPTYFPIHLSPQGLPYIDGSLWARNPLALGVVEAIGVLDWPRDEILALSLGCTSTRLRVSWRTHGGSGSSYWSARIADVFMKAQSSSSIAMANSLIGAENVVRISPDTSERNFTIDGIEHIPALEALGRAEAERTLPGLADRFFAAPAETFEPAHRIEDWDAAVAAAAAPDATSVVAAS